MTRPNKPDNTDSNSNGTFNFLLKSFALIVMIVVTVYMIVSLFTQCTIVNLGTIDTNLNVDSIKTRIDSSNTELMIKTHSKGGD